MSLTWIHETPAMWEPSKARIIGGCPAGIFSPSLVQSADGDLLPGEWWRVEDGRATVGFGWLDVVWGDAEILLATDPQARGNGIGTFILDRLEVEAAARGLNYLYNVVPPTHPDHDQVTAWLERRRFKASADGKLLRAVVRPSTRNSVRPPPS